MKIATINFIYLCLYRLRTKKSSAELSSGRRVASRYIAKVVPDHEAQKADLIIEAKYVRKGSPPSKASNGIAADITKYPSDKFILFVVYDPDRAISDDPGLKKDIESTRSCLVEIIG